MGVESIRLELLKCDSACYKNVREGYQWIYYLVLYVHKFRGESSWYEGLYGKYAYSREYRDLWRATWSV